MRALIGVDIQNCFCPGGTLPVENGDLVVPVFNRIAKHYKIKVASQDWHPWDHGSFAANNPGTVEFQMGSLRGKPQRMWPKHGIQGTDDANFHPDLDIHGVTIFRKGTDPAIDSYSAFFDNDEEKSTGLHEFLHSVGVTELDIMGLATDYCVVATVLHAVKLGYKVRLIEDGCRGIDKVGCSNAIQSMRDAKVEIVESSAL